MHLYRVTKTMKPSPLRFCLCLIATLSLVQTARADIIMESGPPLNDIDVAPPGVSTFLTITDMGVINDLDLSVEITGTFALGIDITLIHVDTGTSAAVFQSAGDNLGSFNVTFDDEAAGGCPHTSDVTGSCIPDNLLSIFDGENIQGSWEIHFEDNSGLPGDGDDLIAWSITADVSPASAPIPASLWLVAPGLVAMLRLRRRRART